MLLFKIYGGIFHLKYGRGKTILTNQEIKKNTCDNIVLLNKDCISSYFSKQILRGEESHFL